MNVRNEPLHDMPCVLLLLENVKPPPNGGRNFVSFNMENDISFGNNFDWVEGVTTSNPHTLRQTSNPHNFVPLM